MCQWGWWQCCQVPTSAFFLHSLKYVVGYDTSRNKIGAQPCYCGSYQIFIWNHPSPMTYREWCYSITTSNMYKISNKFQFEQPATLYLLSPELQIKICKYSSLRLLELCHRWWKNASLYFLITFYSWLMFVREESQMSSNTN